MDDCMLASRGTRALDDCMLTQQTDVGELLDGFCNALASWPSGSAQQRLHEVDDCLESIAAALVSLYTFQERVAARAAGKSTAAMNIVRAHLQNNPNGPCADAAVDWARRRKLARSRARKAAEEAEEERLAIEEEERAQAEWEAAQARRGQVVTAVSTSGQRGSVLDAAREGEETARREMLEAAAAAAAERPVVVAGTAVLPGSECDSDGALPVVAAVEVATGLEPPGQVMGRGVPALMNQLRL